MPKRCQVTGKRRRKGNNVSHSVRRTKRSFDPNLQIKKVFNFLTGKFVKVRVSTRGMRNLAKNPKKFFAKLAD